METYCIKKEYIARTEYIHYDDRGVEDQWQLEVYLHALGLMKKHNLTRVADIGCGSAFKLMTYLSDYETIGLELGVNLDYLNTKYPNHIWQESNFEINPKIETDVLICSDVIEHIVNPDDLIKYINQFSFKYLVLSTPVRDLMYAADSIHFNGPPANGAHQREWAFGEFNSYIKKHFNVLDHRITNYHQFTQTMICSKK